MGPRHRTGPRRRTRRRRRTPRRTWRRHHSRPPRSSKSSGTSHRKRWLIVGGIATAVAVAGVAIGVGSGNSVTTGSGTSGNSQLAVPPSRKQWERFWIGGSGSGGSGSDQDPFGGLFGGLGGLGNGGNGSQGNGNSGNGGGMAATATAAVSGTAAVPGNGSGGSTGTASSDQQVGVVDIDTVLGYQSARAAGTGMVLTSNGEILTNNHVVRGATSITVTVVSTGKTYKASVVGTDPTEDVAVLQLSGASGLQTAHCPLPTSRSATQSPQSGTLVAPAARRALRPARSRPSTRRLRPLMTTVRTPNN